MIEETRPAPTLWRIATAAPHRRAVLCGLASLLASSLWWALHLLARYTGSPLFTLDLAVAPIWAHSFLMLFTVFPTFFLGFLFTTYPRWMNGPLVPRGAYVASPLLLTAASTCWLVGIHAGTALLATRMARAPLTVPNERIQVQAFARLLMDREISDQQLAQQPGVAQRLRGLDLQTQVHLLAAGGVQVEAEDVFAQLRQIDLLQGAYSRKEQYGKLWRPWRAAAALLLAVVIVSGIQHALALRSLKAEAAALGAQIEQVYKQAFPGGRVVNPRVQMEQQLKLLRAQQGGGGSDFLGLLAQLGGVFAATPGIELVGASYRDGRLDLELTASDIQTLEKLKQQISSQGGLTVDIQSATTGADQRIQGRLRVEGARS